MGLGKIFGISSENSTSRKNMDRVLRCGIADINKEKVTLDNLKKTLEHPAVVKAFNKRGGSNWTYADWVARGINNCVFDLPEQELLPLGKFMANNAIIKTAIEQHSSIARDIASTLPYLIDRTPLKQKEDMAKALAEENFGRIVFGKQQPSSDFILYLAEGLRIEAFESILLTTKFFHDIPHDDYTKELYLETDVANLIALDRLLIDRPELRDHKSICGKSLPNIKDIDIPEKEKDPYKDQAWKILKFAFNQCKGAPRQCLNNDHTLG